MTEPTPDPTPPTPVEPVNPAPIPPTRPRDPEDQPQTRRPRARSIVEPQGYNVGGVVPPGNAYTVGESGPVDLDWPGKRIVSPAR